VTRSQLSRLGRVKYALALLAALATSGAIRAHAAGGSCVIGYPFKSSDPRTDVGFNESEVLRAFSPERTVDATPGLTIKVWYNDEHALTLGIRRVVVRTKTGTTTTDYPVSALSSNPGSDRFSPRAIAISRYEKTRSASVMCPTTCLMLHFPGS